MKNIIRQQQRYAFRMILIASLNCLFQLNSISVDANNISITNPKLTNQNTTDNYTFVQFDISWDNSWRTAAAPFNWDAAWVFVKYKLKGDYVSAVDATSLGTILTVSSTTGLRVGMPITKTAGSGTIAAGTVVTSITDATHFIVSVAPNPVLSGGAVVTGTAIWEHAKLNTSGHTAPSGSTIDTPTDGTGIFIYRSGNGTGGNTWTKARLRWNYGADNIADNDKVDINVYGIEMVYVPQGSFAIGDGTSDVAIAAEATMMTSSSIDTVLRVRRNFTPIPITSTTAQFNAYNSTSAYQISSESIPGTLGGATAGTLRNNNKVGMTTADDFDNTVSVTLPSAFPKGYNAFYCMKYEISQQGYVDFLNTLTSTKAANRYPGVVTDRHSINVVSDIYSCSNPYVACNWLKWSDLAAYLDWSGLRPMTEFEFEKSCRGTKVPVAGEYAWGTVGVANSTYILSNTNQTDESIGTNFSTSVGNANYILSSATIAGPTRVGIFAGTSGNTGIVTAGATYYGIMEMSGNLSERTITVGNSTGRAFTSIHGDGVLDLNGDANTSTWPGTNAIGSNLRGGSYAGVANLMRISDRSNGATTLTTRTKDAGGRGVRLAP